MSHANESGVTRPSATSRTQTQVEQPGNHLRERPAVPVITGRLVVQPISGQPGAELRRVTWNENVIDNEGMGKKKSKVCCIYSKPRQHLDESSSEDEDSDGEDGPNDYEREPRRRNPVIKRQSQANVHKAGKGACCSSSSS